MIELKTDTLPAAERSLLVQATIGEVLRAQARHDVALISFDREALREAHARAPAILHGHLFARVSEDDILAGTRAIDSRLAMPEKSLITPSLCEKAAAAGLQLATWVVDDVGEWRRLASLGLYGVGSNCPGDLLSAARDAPHSAEHTTTT
jgi:glycerophosphoryl diester phosphodiesterase